MPNIAPLLQKHSEWLRPYMVSRGDLLVIQGEGIIDERFGRPRLVIEVEHEGIRRRIALNQKSLRALARAFGPDTREWVGKQARVREIRFYPSLGTEAIFLEPVKTPTDGKPEDLRVEVERARWREGRYGGEIASASQLPLLSKRLLNQQTIEINGLVYKLSRNRRWVVRFRKRAR